MSTGCESPVGFQEVGQSSSACTCTCAESLVDCTGASAAIPENLFEKLRESMQSLNQTLKARGFSKTQREQVLDENLFCVSKAIMQKNPSHIIIRVTDLKGFGDLLFALKLTDELVKKLPNIKIAIAFENEATIQKVKSVASEYPYYQHCYVLSEIPEEFKNPKNGLCIGAASLYFGLKDEEFNYKAMGLRDDYPILTLPEYGCRETPNDYYERVKVTGLTKNQYGIFIDNKMTQIVEEDARLSKDPLLHMTDLTEIQLLRDIKPDGRSVEDYSSKTKLFFGYGHQILSQIHFIRSVVHAEQVDQKNIDMVLVFDQPAELEASFDPVFIAEMKELGIGRIEIVGTSLNRPTSIKIADEGKVLRIIPRRGIFHQDFGTCLVMSQPLSLCSGDQSFSEAVSANKICFYEVYIHKLLFDNSMKSLAAELGLSLVKSFFEASMVLGLEEEMLEISKKWTEDTVPCWCRKSYQWAQTKDEYRRLYGEYLSKPEFHAQWKVFLKHVQQNHCLGDRIVPLVGRVIAGIYFKEISEFFSLL